MATGASGSTAADRQMAERLDALRRELDQERGKLPEDALHCDVWQDLARAELDLRRAIDKLLLNE